MMIMDGHGTMVDYSLDTKKAQTRHLGKCLYVCT
jgi:hypothetical protein